MKLRTAPLKNTFLVVALLIAWNMVVPAFGSTVSAKPPPNLDVAWLKPLIADFPPGAQTAIQADLVGFSQALATVLSADSDLLVLLDKKVGLPAGYVPPDLVSLVQLKPALPVKKATPPLQLRRILVPDLQAMERTARKAGINLDISSAYRSYDYQTTLFARYVRELGQTEAERQSAHAGHSQHQLGLAIDFGSITPEFAFTKAGKWLFTHAGEFGFSLSYPEGHESETGYMYEPWHYRFIGRDAARLQKKWFGDSQQLMLVFLDRHGVELRQKLAIANKS